MPFDFSHIGGHKIAHTDEILQFALQTGLKPEDIYDHFQNHVQEHLDSISSIQKEKEPDANAEETPENTS